MPAAEEDVPFDELVMHQADDAMFTYWTGGETCVLYELVENTHDRATAASCRQATAVNLVASLFGD